MFGKSQEVGAEKLGHSLLQEGVVVRGEIEANGDMRLDGKVEGKLIVTQRITIGSEGVVMADVEAAEVVVMGSVQGTVKAHRRIELRKGARLVGDVITPVLVIEEGVHFHGNSNMNAEVGPGPTVKPTAVPEWVQAGRSNEEPEVASMDQVSR